LLQYRKKDDWWYLLDALLRQAPLEISHAARAFPFLGERLFSFFASLVPSILCGGHFLAVSHLLAAVSLRWPIYHRKASDFYEKKRILVEGDALAG
jgi:hypothetical protein